MIVRLSMPRIIPSSYLAILLIVAESSTALASEFLRPVAITGATYQGTTGPRIFDSFNSLEVNRLGQVTFDAYFPGSVGGLPDHGIWSERNGGVLREVVHTGDLHPAVTTPNRFLVAIVTTPQSDEGVIAFLDEILDDADGPRRAVWLGVPNQDLRLIAVNKPIDGVSAFRVPDVSNLLTFGDVFASGHVALGVITDSIYLSDPNGTVRFIANKTSAVPGVPGARFNSLGGLNLNDAGQLAWSGFLDGVPVNTNFGLWKELTAGESSLAIRQGDIAPGTDGKSFYRFLSHSLDNQGSVAFSSWLLTDDSVKDVGVWTETPANGIRPILLEGDAAPGTAPGITFGNMDRQMPSPAYDHSGAVAIRASLVGPEVSAEDDSGIWATHESNLRLVAREGDAAPGTGPGVVFSNLYSGASYQINRNGRVAFSAFLTGTGINSSNDSGIWAETPEGKLELIAREGDLTTGDFSPGVPPSGLLPGTFYFGDGGHLAFRAGFRGTDQSAIFVSSLASVPEPGAFALFCGLVLCALPQIGTRAR